MLKRGDYLMIEHKHDDGVYIKDSKTLPRSWGYTPGR